MAIVYVMFILLHGFGTGAVLEFTRPYLGQTRMGRDGLPFNFTWTFSGVAGSIEWGIKKSGVNVFTANGKILSLKNTGEKVFHKSGYDGRVTGNWMSGQLVIEFNAVNRNDTNSYLCILRADSVQDDDQFDGVHLIVEGPPIITHVSDNQTANEGDEVMLNCKADGNPPPNITWTRLSSNSRVTFPLVVSRHDGGGYRCTADNGIAIKTHDVFITVQYAAVVKSVTPVTSQSWIGHTVKLTCVADGVPTPNVSWKNPSGKVIQQGIGLRNIINVSMSSDQDFGNYTCEATNDVDTDTKTVLVQQIKAPGSPTVRVDIEATSINVSWTKPADNGGRPITAYRVLILRGNTEIENRITDLSVKYLYIGSLNKSTNYTIKLFARNEVFEGKATERKIRTKYEGVPAAAEITGLPGETKDVEITLKWKEAENNGAPIDKYTVYRRTVREDGTSLIWIKLNEIKDTSNREVVVNVEKGKVYEFVVTATNEFGEGGKEEGQIRKIKVLGGVPSTVIFKYELKADKIILTWVEPNNNGAEITMYTVYYGTESDEQWKETEKITNVLERNYMVKVEMGRKYKVLVTASNKHGESSKEGNVQHVEVPEGLKPSAQPKTDGMNAAVVAGAAASGVLVIVGFIIFAIWWKRRKSSSDDASPSASALRGDNPYELDDGYQDVSASVAARGLQAEAGPVAEPDYAQVDMSKKKRNRRPVIDEYAQVDKSKTFKKPRKQPGELNYAELDDFRPSVQPAAASAAAAAEAAPARPLIRRPAYEGTEYADITQFGVPQPEPTYGNVPKKDVVYSNVQGI